MRLLLILAALVAFWVLIWPGCGSSERLALPIDDPGSSESTPSPYVSGVSSIALPAALIKAYEATEQTPSPTPATTPVKFVALSQGASWPSVSAVIDEARAEPALREEEMLAKEDALFAALDSAIQTIDGKSLNGELGTLAALEPLLVTFGAQSATLLKTHQEFLAALKAYEQSLLNAPLKLQQAAAAHRQHAAEELYPDLRDIYLKWADTLEALARAFVARSKSLEKDGDAVRESAAYLERHAVLIGRLRDSLASLPALPPGYAQDDLLSQLRGYTGRADKLRKSLQQFHQRLTGPTALSPVVRSKALVPQPPASALASALRTVSTTRRAPSTKEAP